MHTLWGDWNRKKFFNYLPDFWFLAILLVGWGEFINVALFGTWHVVEVIMGICLLLLTGVLVKQLINRKVVVSALMGIFFLLCSLFLSLALFSELREFSKITDPHAIELLLGGVIVVGGSLVMSVLMMLRNTFKLSD